MEYLGNILGTSLEYPLNVPATSTFHLCTDVFETFVIQSENIFNSVHFVRKWSKSPKSFKIAEIVQNRRNRSKLPKSFKIAESDQMWSNVIKSVASFGFRLYITVILFCSPTHSLEQESSVNYTSWC